MHFDLSDIRAFIHVAESSSITQGARRANLSTAATSARIKGLEGELGAKLFYRDSRGATLTPAGEKLLKHARVIMRQVDHVKSEFAEYGSGLFGHIRIFANTTAVTEYLPEILARFLAERSARHGRPSGKIVPRDRPGCTRRLGRSRADRGPGRGPRARGHPPQYRSAAAGGARGS